MGKWLLVSNDFDGYFCEAQSAVAKGSIVVLQEIFGVNSHIRDVCDHYATLGFNVLAPSLFDPVERRVELGYDDRGVVRGRQFVEALGFERALTGVQKAIEWMAQKYSHDRLAVMGYCWGGSLAFLAAAKLPKIDGAVCYYGRHIFDFRNESPHVPVLYHYGKLDPMILPEHVEAVKQAQPKGEFYLYQAGHGFNCDQRKDFDSTSARLAEERTLEFISKLAISKKVGGCPCC